MTKRKVLPVNYCLDCNKLIDYRWKRCLACFKLYRHNSPEFAQQKSDAARKQWATNTDYRLLMTAKKEHKCLDCGGVVSRQATRCKSCSIKDRWTHAEYRQHRHELIKKQWTDINYRKLMLAALLKQWDNPDSKMRISLYKRWHLFKPSSLELKFKTYLDAADIVYVQQYKPQGYNRVYDFMLPDYDTLIEIDGMFWHYSDYAIRKGSADVDAEKEEWAIAHGFDLVHIPEDDMPADIVTAWLIPEMLEGVTNAI
jgi:very-short-patch-repair endonuclease